MLSGECIGVALIANGHLFHTQSLKPPNEHIILSNGFAEVGRIGDRKRVLEVNEAQRPVGIILEVLLDKEQCGFARTDLSGVEE